ncbi:unnamed protein product [Blepharisma stoltei]|uniref:F-box domain-containing protein n=1 Tax=Blepharisma stoltei TaxID=1481888 RepID=A0AAU9JGF5_9CILI|nr:unnamed protein product [Blepharisma stoltei]
MDSLPDEIATEIFGFLAANDLCTVSLINKRFHSLAQSNFIWKNVFSRRWNMVPSSEGNLKEFYANLNCRVTGIISQYQSENHRLQELLAFEKKRQLESLNQRIQEKKNKRFIKELEMSL